MSALSELTPSTLDGLKSSAGVRRLTDADRANYRDQGYLKNLPVFDSSTMGVLQRRFHELVALVPHDVDVNRINMWHKANATVAELGRTPAILDYVEDLIGPDFYQWGGQFFVKYPGDGSVVPWHQDSQYWPLTPCESVSVWLAIYDTDHDNGAMQIVRGSHRQGNFPHHDVDEPCFVLEQEVDDGTFETEEVVTLDLKAGEISLHDAGLLHGSAANESRRIRAGLTMRYCAVDVKCDMSVWPTFEATMVRGTDRFAHNPQAGLPTRDGFPVAKFQHSSEFD